MSKLQEYIDADKTIKAAEKIKEKHKFYVTKLLRRCKRMGIDVKEVTYSEASRFEFIEDKLYEWVASKVTEQQLEDMVDIKRTINMEKLKEFYLAGIINTLDIPPECYKETRYSVLRVKG